MHSIQRPRTLASVLAVLVLIAAPSAAAAQAAFLTSKTSFLRMVERGVAPSMPEILIPVWGIEAEQLRDSYQEGRSGGRTHRAIDIHAPRGTPVIAVADGVILRLHEGNLGGLSIYHLAEDGRTRYYYAHLDRYAEGLVEGKRVRQGEVIGYVGDTGNAAPGDYHLHFSIAVLSDRNRWWQGRTTNPYQALKRAYEGR